MRNFLPVLGLALVGTLLSACASSAAALTPDQITAIEAYVTDRYPDEGAGVSVLISVGGEPQLVINRGFANLEWDIPNDEFTAFRLGSISKPLTAVALLQLAERGTLDLDVPVSTYMPDLPAHMGRVTARQLMSHTSGLADHVFDARIIPFIRSGMTFEQILVMHGETPPNFEPGAQYEYCNFNYTLLGHLLSVLSGKSYSDYMEQDVFAALGMAHSASDDRRDIVPHRAQNYAVEGDVFLHAENVDMSHVGAAGLLLSSPTDLAHWFDLLTQGALISDHSRTLAWTEVIPADGEGGGYGLGFNVRERNGAPFIFHTGLTPGAHGAVGTYPDQRIVIVVLGNGFHLPSTGSAMFWIADEVMDAALD